MIEYSPKEIEPKWQEKWLKENIFAASDAAPKPKMYVLDMFPYPSGDGLHVGHAKIYTSSDVISRYLRMKGFNVLHPTGWDAFGLPAENSAIKFGIHPAELTKRNIERFRQQMRRLGLSYDWDREVNTTDPNYYKWTQWIFLQLFKMGLAYEATVPINWCPSCKTGLANEEVVDGACERCGALVEQKPLRQWMLRITKYADQLLTGLDGLDWPNFIKELQQNWIGRSEGVEMQFPLDRSDKDLSVFTTRLDTVFGVTGVVIAPDHPLLDEITPAEHKEAVEAYRLQATAQEKIPVTQKEEKDKTGVFTGVFALNPVNNEKVPVWVADYVTMTYGTGAVMLVPAHDERDFEFAQKYSLPVKQVIVPELSAGEAVLPYTEEGIVINSGRFDGRKNKEAAENILADLQAKGIAKKKIYYKLRDWVFSRQRYWGEPIPLIHCDKCGTVPVPDKDLPVELPPLKSYQPTGTGESPLAGVEEWVKVKCPTCPRIGRRETNTMPQWAGSSWYWLRYLDPNNQEALADPSKIEKWMPVDVYVGGAEHAVLHLLYARFWYKALYDRGNVFQAEPFQRFRSVGLVLGEDGQKMSKSRGNVINPDQVIDEYGADTLRIYEMFMGPFDQPVAWSTSSIKGVYRFLKRTWTVVEKLSRSSGSVEQPEIELILHRTIKRVSESTEQFKFNTAISALMEFLNVLEKHETVSTIVLEKFILMLSPYAPHIAEELWHKLGHTESLAYQPWPVWNEKVLARASSNLPVQVNGKVRGFLTVQPDIEQSAVETAAKGLPNVNKYLAQGTVKKVIYIPGKMLNFVVGN